MRTQVKAYLKQTKLMFTVNLHSVSVSIPDIVFLDSMNSNELGET